MNSVRLKRDLLPTQNEKLFHGSQELNVSTMPCINNKHTRVLIHSQSLSNLVDIPLLECFVMLEILLFLI